MLILHGSSSLVIFLPNISDRLLLQLMLLTYTTAILKPISPSRKLVPPIHLVQPLISSWVVGDASLLLRTPLHLAVMMTLMFWRSQDSVDTLFLTIGLLSTRISSCLISGFSPKVSYFPIYQNKIVINPKHRPHVLRDRS